MNTFVCKYFIFDVDATLLIRHRLSIIFGGNGATQNAIEFSKVIPHVHGRKISETLALVGSKYSNPEEEAVKNRLQWKAIAATEIDGVLILCQTYL
ncbi:hypothetical protein O9992_00595 [Vibrio lentus]|nr:hypothetical protein [Vibrio lentus]